MVALLDRFLQRSAPAPMSNAAVIERVQLHLKYHAAEMEAPAMRIGFARRGLVEIHQYLRGLQPHPSIPGAATPEIRGLAMMSRVNVLDLIVSAVAQAMYVDGYRADPKATEQDPAWAIWQANKMDARQAGIHRSALSYGVAYATVLPGVRGSGDPMPVIRGHSPRRMQVLYGSDPEWPMTALQLTPSGGHWALRLYDDNRVHELAADTLDGSGIEYLQNDVHGAGVTPVVRFLNVEDLDEDNMGEVERLIPLQDQIDETTFDLMVAQKYGAFRQRYVIGWTTDDENAKVKASASRLWLFEDGQDTVKVGEFDQTVLDGFIASREASIRHAAALSQTPAHELLGQLVNLSAEALVAAEAAQRRKVLERQTSFGESHEQMLELAAQLGGIAGSSDLAQVRWRDTESRAFAATVDGLVKLGTLGVPLQLLIARIPGFTQQDIEAAIALLENGDPLTALKNMLNTQITAPPGTAPPAPPVAGAGA